MKRLLIIAAAALATTACAGLDNLRKDDKPYDNPFYAKYLNTGSSLDGAITRTLDGLRQNPDSAELHNTLGALLLDKGFPGDAEREFERAVDANGKYYQAWYNLGLVRSAHGNEHGARRAFARTVDLKPGHAQALFQLGLVEEINHHTDRAVHYYTKAFTINPALMRVDANPRILDSKLTHLAFLNMYDAEHSRRSMQLQGTISSMMPSTAPPPAASPQPAPKDIVTPAPPATEIGVEPTPVHAPSSVDTSVITPPPPPRRTRGRARRPPANDGTTTTAPATPPPAEVPVEATPPPPPPK
jgi:hypothetical protein